MSPRSIRRAAERKQLKLARKAARQIETQQPAQPEPTEALDFTPEPAQPTSPAQLAANRANAQHSTGPKTCAGKANSSLNAVKTGLTGRAVLLPSDDASEYERHARAYYDELQPIGQRESDLAQSIADTAWRLKRIPGLESAIYAQGHVDFADSFDDHSPALRPGLIELHTFLAYEKQLRNLQLQEARLHRRLMKDTAELRSLQQERKSKEAQVVEIAAAQNGFVFSTRPPAMPPDAFNAPQTAIRDIQLSAAAADTSVCTRTNGHTYEPNHLSSPQEA